MLKIGKVQLYESNEDYFIMWYSDDKLNERIDVIKNLNNYNIVNTSNCAVSYITGAMPLVCGNMSLITSILKIKYLASSLHVPEDRKVSIEDGNVKITVSKVSQDGGTVYNLETTSGTLSKEEYITPIGSLIFSSVQKSTSVPKDKPINSGDYIKVTIGDAGNVRKDGSGFYSYDELLRKYPQVSHVLKENYVVAGSYEEAEERLKDWIEAKEQLKSFDIESTGTDWGPVSDCRITGVILGYGTHTATYFPFRQDNFKYNLPIEFLRRIFDAINNQPPAPEVLLLAHNVKFEIQGFYQEFRDFVRFDIDTYLLAVLQNPIVQKGTHTLKSLTAKVDGNFYLELNQIFYDKVKFNVLPEDIVKIYACPDATSPAKIYPYLMSKIPKDEHFVIGLEMKIPVIKAMNEFYGMRMDRDRLNELIENTEKDVDLLRNTFMKIHHTSKNINSYDVMSDILYNKLKCKVEVYTKNGLPATSKVAIDRIIRLGSNHTSELVPADLIGSDGKVLISGKELAANKYPSLIIYQKYKSETKILGALKRLRDHSVAGYFKFYINQSGAGSNRQTSDAHQFDDTMKSCALADSPYHGLVSCDWKQVELRILAGLAGQQDLIELEKDMDVDIHRAVQSIITGKPMYLISEEERKAIKSINFGVVYMMSEYGLAARDYGPGYTKENVNEERKKITDFFNGLPYVKNFIKGNEEFLKAHGYIKTAFGYYRYFPDLLDPTTPRKKIKSYIRAGNNTPVQGTGAQMLKMVENNVWNYIREKGWDKEKDYDGMMLPMVRMIVPIHDEILLSYDKSIPKEEIISMFKECMELKIKNMPPFYAAPAFIDNWYQGKDSLYEVDLPLRDKIVEDYHNGHMTFNENNYLDVLQTYREGEIRDYMNNLIVKYKDKDKVAKHVNHDSLTHTLIETMIPSKKDRKKLTHQQRIEKAVELYMDNVDINLLAAQAEKTFDEEEDKKINVEEWAEASNYVDENGDIIEQVTEDDDYYETYEDVEEDIDVKECRVIYGVDECIINITGCDKSIYDKISELSREGAYYRVILVVGSKSLATDLYVDSIQDKLEMLFEKEKV